MGGFPSAHPHWDLLCGFLPCPKLAIPHESSCRLSSHPHYSVTTGQTRRQQQQKDIFQPNMMPAEQPRPLLCLAYHLLLCLHLAMALGGLSYSHVPICPTYIASHLISSEIPGCHWHDCAYTGCTMQAKQPFIQGDTVTFLPPFLLHLSKVETLTPSDSKYLIEPLQHQCLIIPCSLRGCKNAPSVPLSTECRGSIDL